MRSDRRAGIQRLEESFGPPDSPIEDVVAVNERRMGSNPREHLIALALQVRNEFWLAVVAKDKRACSAAKALLIAKPDDIVFFQLAALPRRPDSQELVRGHRREVYRCWVKRRFGTT